MSNEQQATGGIFFGRVVATGEPGTFATIEGLDIGGEEATGAPGVLTPNGQTVVAFNLGPAKVSGNVRCSRVGDR